MTTFVGSFGEQQVQLIVIYKNRVRHSSKIDISAELVSTQSDVLTENIEKQLEKPVTDIDFQSNSTFNVTNIGDKKVADDKWLEDVRFAIEGVTQLFVGLVGLIGKTKYFVYKV